MAEYFASVNRSGGRRQSYTLKTAPRPSGRATRVIMTEYELPRPDITEPHDVVVDQGGARSGTRISASSLSASSIPKTGKVTEYPLPANKPDAPIGSLDLEFDRQRQSLGRHDVPGRRSPSSTRRPAR